MARNLKSPPLDGPHVQFSNRTEVRLSLRSKLVRLASQIAKRENDYTAAISSLQLTVAELQAQLVEKAALLNNERLFLESSLRESDREKDTVQQEVQSLLEEIKTLRKHAELQQTHYLTLLDEKSSLEHRLNQVQSEFTTLNATLLTQEKSYQDELERVQGELKDTILKVGDLLHQNSFLNDSVNQLRQANSHLSKKCKELSTGYEEIQATLLLQRDAHQLRETSLAEEVNSIRETAEKLKQDYTDAKQETHRLLTENASLIKIKDSFEELQLQGRFFTHEERYEMRQQLEDLLILIESKLSAST